MRKVSEISKTLGKILLFMYVLTAILLFLLAFIVKEMQPGEGMINISISIIYVVSCSLGGLLAGKIMKKQKFIWGLLLGMFYFLLMLLITVTVREKWMFSFLYILYHFLLCAGGGMIGGMVS